jgi:hypothetical protein
MYWAFLAIPALLAGCAEPEPLYLWERHLGGVWCYRTIAEPDCYLAPLPRQADRLIASGPEIYFSWRRNPAFEPAPARGTLIND